MEIERDKKISPYPVGRQGEVTDCGNQEDQRDHYPGLQGYRASKMFGGFSNIFGGFSVAKINPTC